MSDPQSPVDPATQQAASGSLGNIMPGAGGPVPVDPAAQQAASGSLGNIAPGGGGGRIDVEPASLSSAAGSATGVAQGVMAAGGGLGAAAAAAAGCDPSVAGAFDAMQSAWTGQARFLGQADGGLASALGSSSVSYPATDEAAMRGVWLA